MRIAIVSSQQDSAFSQKLARALRNVGANVWYDEEHQDNDHLSAQARQQIQDRSVYLVVLSPASLVSPWILHATTWAHQLSRTSQRKLVAVPLRGISAFEWTEVFGDFVLIAPNSVTPYASEEAISQTLVQLHLVMPSQLPTVVIFDGHAVASHLKQGQMLLKKEQYVEAIHSLNHARMLMPNAIEIYMLLGYAYARCHKYVQALDAYEQTLVIIPEHADAWLGKALALLALKRYEASLIAFTHMLTVDAWSVRAWAGKGKALALLGRQQEAIAAFEKALFYEPTYTYAQRNLDRIVQGSNLVEISSSEETLQI